LAEIQTSYWSDATRVRAEEDRVMAGEIESRTAPIRHQLIMLLDQREELTKQLQEIKRQCELVKAELDEVTFQFGGAKQIMAADRQRKDENAQAWFNYTMSRITKPHPQLNGAGPQQNGYTVESKARANGQTPDPGNLTAISSHVEQPTSLKSSPLSELRDAS
jgi:hypothetical protein